MPTATCHLGHLGHLGWSNIVQTTPSPNPERLYGCRSAAKRQHTVNVFKIRRRMSSLFVWCVWMCSDVVWCPHRETIPHCNDVCLNVLCKCSQVPAWNVLTACRATLTSPPESPMRGLNITHSFLTACRKDALHGRTSLLGSEDRTIIDILILTLITITSFCY